MKLRLLLLLLAVATVGTLVRLTRFNAALTPEGLLEQARTELVRADTRLDAYESAETRPERKPDPPNYDTVLRTLDRAAELAAEGDERAVQREILYQRAATFRHRWDYSARTTQVVHAATDLEAALRTAEDWLDAFAPNDQRVLALATRCALDLGLPADALSFLARVDELPSSPGAVPLLMGEAHAALAANELGQLEDVLGHRFSRREAGDTFALAREAAARPLGDPQRIALLDRILADVPSALADEVRARIDAATARLELAINAYATALEDTPSGVAVHGLQRILRDARAFQRAIDLGRLALSRSDLSERSLVWGETMRAMVDAGRVAEARREIDEVFWRGEWFDFDVFDTPELHDFCRFLHRIEAWIGLSPCGQKLIERYAVVPENTSQRGEAHFFKGVASSHSANPGRILFNLGNVPTTGVETIPGMRVELWNAYAKCYAHLGDTRAQRAALRRVEALTEVFPTDPRVRRAAGEAWLEHGRIQSEEELWYAAEDQLARALCLLPERADEIRPLWEDVGARSIRAHGRNVDRVKRNPSQRDSLGSFPSMEAYEACVRARANLDLGRTVDVGLLLQPVLETYPGLPMALHALAEAEVLRGRYDAGVEAELSIAALGYSPVDDASALLARVPPSALTGDQIRRWMLLDPAAGGLERVVSELERTGDRARLARFVEARPPSDAKPEQRVRIAIACSRLGLFDDAYRWINSMRAETPAVGANAGVAMRAAIVSSESDGHRHKIENFTEKLLECPNIDDPEFPLAADALLAIGEVERATALLANARPNGAAARGDVLLRSAVAQLIAGNASRPGAREAFERCAGMRADASAEFGSLLLAIEAGNRSEVKRLAAALVPTSLFETAADRALLTAFAGDPHAALDALLAAAAGPQPDARAAMLTTAALRRLAPFVPERPLGDELGGTPRVGADAPWGAVDPNLSAALLLATRLRPFAPWVLAIVERLAPAVRDTPNAAQLRALAWESLGRGDLAQAELAAWTTSADNPDLWRMRKRLVANRSGASFGGDFDRLLRERYGNVGAAGLAPAEVARVRVQEHLERGADGAATRAVEEGRRQAPHDFYLALMQARLAARAATDLRGALDLYDGLVESHRDAFAPYVDEFVSLLRTARTSGALSIEAEWAALDALEAAYPRNASLPRILATLRINTAEQTRDWGLQRAWNHLERFRQRTRPSSIDALTPGEAEAWWRLIKRYDPARAERFALQELNANPASAELWGVWCEALVTVGKREQALAAYETILALAESPTLRRGYALLRLDLGLPSDEDASRMLADASDVDQELAMRCAFALMQGEGERADEARRIARELWADRDRNDLPLSPFARRLALGLAESAPDEALAVLDGAIDETRDPLEALTLRATRHLLTLAEAPVAEVAESTDG